MRRALGGDRVGLDELLELDEVAISDEIENNAALKQAFTRAARLYQKANGGGPLVKKV